MDFTSETMQARKEWCEIFKVSKKKKNPRRGISNNLYGYSQGGKA